MCVIQYPRGLVFDSSPLLPVEGMEKRTNKTSIKTASFSPRGGTIAEAMAESAPIDLSAPARCKEMVNTIDRDLSKESADRVAFMP